MHIHHTHIIYTHTHNAKKDHEYNNNTFCMIDLAPTILAYHFTPSTDLGTPVGSWKLSGAGRQRWFKLSFSDV